MTQAEASSKKFVAVQASDARACAFRWLEQAAHCIAQVRAKLKSDVGLTAIGLTF